MKRMQSRELPDCLLCTIGLHVELQARPSRCDAGPCVGEDVQWCMFEWTSKEGYGINDQMEVNDYKAGDRIDCGPAVSLVEGEFQLSHVLRNSYVTTFGLQFSAQNPYHINDLIIELGLKTRCTDGNMQSAYLFEQYQYSAAS